MRANVLTETGENIPNKNDGWNGSDAMSRKNTNVEDKSQDAKRIDDSTVGDKSKDDKRIDVGTLEMNHVESRSEELTFITVKHELGVLDAEINTIIKGLRMECDKEIEKFYVLANEMKDKPQPNFAGEASVTVGGNKRVIKKPPDKIESDKVNNTTKENSPNTEEASRSGGWLGSNLKKGQQVMLTVHGSAMNNDKEMCTHRKINEFSSKDEFGYIEPSTISPQMKWECSKKNLDKSDV